MSSSDEQDAADEGVTPSPRQRVVRVPGARRARLTAAPGATEEPVPADEPERGTSTPTGERGPNDERLRADVPPHY